MTRRSAWAAWIGVTALVAVCFMGAPAVAGRKTTGIPKHAVQVAPNLYYLGKAVDKQGREVEGYLIVRRRKDARHQPHSGGSERLRDRLFGDGALGRRDGAGRPRLRPGGASREEVAERPARSILPWTDPGGGRRRLPTRHPRASGATPGDAAGSLQRRPVDGAAA
jgi:hypothetical protein